MLGPRLAVLAVRALAVHGAQPAHLPALAVLLGALALFTVAPLLNNFFVFEVLGTLLVVTINALADLGGTSFEVFQTIAVGLETTTILAGALEPLGEDLRFLLAGEGHRRGVNRERLLLH